MQRIQADRDPRHTSAVIRVRAVICATTRRKAVRKGAPKSPKMTRASTKVALSNGVEPMGDKLRLFRDRAEEARTHAETMTNALARRTMLDIAERYEKLIRLLEIDAARRLASLQRNSPPKRG
jgi:hypothetical protein